MTTHNAVQNNALGYPAEAIVWKVGRHYALRLLGSGRVLDLIVQRLQNRALVKIGDIVFEAKIVRYRRHYVVYLPRRLNPVWERYHKQTVVVELAPAGGP